MLVEIFLILRGTGQYSYSEDGQLVFEHPGVQKVLVKLIGECYSSLLLHKGVLTIGSPVISLGVDLGSHIGYHFITNEEYTVTEGAVCPIRPLDFTGCDNFDSSIYEKVLSYFNR